MRITVHLSACYDWVPVPPDVVVAPADVAAGLAKVGARGEHLMRVPKKGDTHTTILLPEQQILAKILHEKLRPGGGRILSRKEAVEQYVAEHCLATETQRPWIKGFEVHDDQHELAEAPLHALLAPHVVTGNIPSAHVIPHRDAYLEKADAAAIEDHLTAKFRVGR